MAKLKKQKKEQDMKQQKQTKDLKKTATRPEAATASADHNVVKIIKDSEAKEVLNNDAKLNKYIATVESLPILKTALKGQQLNLGVQYAENKFKHNTYVKRKKELRKAFNNQASIIRQNDKIFKNNYLNLVHSTTDKVKIDQLTKNYTIVHEMLSCLGDRNTKYFKKDLLEYDSLTSKPILFVRNLTKFYGRKKQPNIDALNFDVYPGEFHAFIGANGAGKTTTIKCLITSYYNWSGTILINGNKNLTEEAKKKIGYIPEKASFPENFSTYNYLKWMVMLSGLNKEDAERIVEKQLRDIGMWNMRNRSPNTFSSGQKKKVLLLQTLIHNPDIIIMDEPVANLDPKARIDFFDKLLELKRQKKAIFISSHVLAELDMYADALTILDGGKIVYTGKKDVLLKKYETGEYSITFDRKYNDKVISFFKRLHLKLTMIDAKENTHKFKDTNEATIEKIQQFFAKNKILLTSFNKIQPSLEDIYRKLIVFGSKDTMAENIAAGKTEGMTTVEHKKKIY